MADIPWHLGVELIEPHIVRISTPQGSGTGFLISYAESTGICGIATAAHVVDHAHDWEEPIRIQHAASNETLLIKQPDRALFIDHNLDTAVILLKRDNLPLPTETLEMTDEGLHLKVGNEIGWLGFPAVSPTDLCFFGGIVSSWKETDQVYLVDGVAINGVSGGPAFYLNETAPVLIGVVSAYVPNRATGETLPGLAVVRGVAQFHELAPTFKSMEQAKEEETPSDEPPILTETETGEPTHRK